MRRKLLIWRVVYDRTFQSSSGMMPYEHEEAGCMGIVWTFGNSLDDVKAAINAGLDTQSRLTHLVSAEYIGTALNSVEAANVLE